MYLTYRFSENRTRLLRGEIRATTMKSKERESRILLTKSMVEGNNNLGKVILWKFLKNNRNQWGNGQKKELKELRMDLKDLQEMSKAKIRNRVREVDREEWQIEVGKLKSQKD